jgi:alpha-glucosidase (family GH31 glycosyl hydrolase)
MQRAQLLPYRYTLARIAHDSGVSLLRPMYYDYPLDENAYDAQLQYLLGPDLLVAPVNSPLDPSSQLASVLVWFPDDDVDFWVEYDDPSVQYPSNGQWVNLSYPLDRVPVFVKAGAIIPLVPYLEAQAIGSASQNYNSLEFVVYPSSSSTTSVSTWVYEDDGISNDYLLYSDMFANTSITFTKQSSTSKCDVLETIFNGSYSGIPATRSYTVRLLATGTTPLTVAVNGMPSKLTKLQNQ